MHHPLASVRRPPRGLAAAALVVLLLPAALFATACGSAGPQILEEAPLPDSVRPQGLVVLPVALAIPETNSLEVAARTAEVSRWLLRRTDLPLVGLFDYALLKGLDEARTAAVDTDLLARGEELGVDIRHYATLHVLVTENRATNTRDIVDQRKADAKQHKTYRQRGFESIVRVEVALYDPMRGRRLASIVVQGEDDPTDFQPGGDPRPGIGRLIDLALGKLLETSQASLLGSGKRFVRGDGLVDSVPALIGFQAPDLPSWQERHRNDADVVREAAVLGLWERFAPEASVLDVHNASASRGVLVRKATPPFEAGDVVLAIDGKPVSAVWQLDRRLGQCEPTGCAVSVYRARQRQELQVRWQALTAAPAPDA